jgi:hypothetical protein
LEFRGTALSKEDFDRGRVITAFYRPNAKYAWATGIAIGRFLSELRDGRIVGRKCNKCGRVVVPPRIFCEWCFRPNDQWVTLPDTGDINTFSISYIATDASRTRKPTVPAVVTIDGTTGAGLLHLIGGISPWKIQIGMRVRAQWKKSEERQGAITDIVYFKPMQGGK